MFLTSRKIVGLLAVLSPLLWFVWCSVFFALAEDAVSRSLSLSLETMKPGSQTSTKLRSLGSNVNGDSWQGTEDTQKDAKMVGH